MLVGLDHRPGRAVGCHPAALEPDRAVAKLGDRTEIVADEHHSPAFAAQVGHRGEAFLPELVIADRKHFVHRQDGRST